MTSFPVSDGKVSDLLRRMALLLLREEDLEETYYRPAGKKSNSKALTGVMLLHRPTGIRVRCNRESSQGINRFIARRSLVEELEARRSSKTRHEVKAEKIRQEKQRRKGSRKRTQALPGVFGRPDVELVRDGESQALQPTGAGSGNMGQLPASHGGKRNPARHQPPGQRKGFDLAEAERGFILRRPAQGLPNPNP